MFPIKIKIIYVGKGKINLIKHIHSRLSQNAKNIKLKYVFSISISRWVTYFTLISLKY